MEDALLAASMSVSALGFVFWPQSPRYIAPDAAKAILALLPPMVAAVGVFVNQPAEEVEEIASSLGLTAVQLHGDEPVEDWNRVSRRIIKAVALEATRDPEILYRYPARVTLLLDAHDPVQRGGTG